MHVFHRKIKEQTYFENDHKKNYLSSESEQNFTAMPSPNLEIRIKCLYDG